MGKRVKLIMMLCILTVFMNIVSLHKVQAESWTRQEVKEELKWAKKELKKSKKELEYDVGITDFGLS